MRNRPVPVPSSTWRSRTEALEALALTRPEADAAALSPARAVLEALLVLTVSALVGGATTAWAHGDAAVGAACTGLALGVLFGLGRLLAAGRRRAVSLRGWEDVERQTRGLPGSVPSELRAPFDARWDPDFPQVAATALGVERHRPYGLRLALRSVLAGGLIALGLAGTIGGALRLAEGREDSGSSASYLVAGLVFLLAGIGAAWWTTAYGWQSTQRWRRMGAERELWSAQRELAGLEVERQPVMSGGSKVVAWGALALLPLFVVGLVTFRAGPAGVLAVAVLLLGLAAVVVAPRLRRQSAARRLRAGTDPGCVVDGPDGLAVLNAGSTGLLLGGRPLPEVLGATRGYQGRPFAELEVHLLQADEAVTLVKTYDRTGLDQVLAGAGVRRLG